METPPILGDVSFSFGMLRTASSIIVLQFKDRISLLPLLRISSVLKQGALLCSGSEPTTVQKEAAASRSKPVQHISMLLERINTYSSAMDVLAQSSKETMLAWGAMRFLLHVILSEKHASEKLCQAITDVVDKLGRFQGYLSNYFRPIKG
jgi:hypothetical protein